MRTGGASGESEASGCSGSGVRRSHQFDTGGMDRLYVRGIENVHKKLLVQAAACNLALLMRSIHGTGKPRAAHDQSVEAILAILTLIGVLESVWEAWWANTDELSQQRIGPRMGRHST